MLVYMDPNRNAAPIKCPFAPYKVIFRTRWRRITVGTHAFTNCRDMLATLAPNTQRAGADHRCLDPQPVCHPRNKCAIEFDQTTCADCCFHRRCQLIYGVFKKRYLLLGKRHVVQNDHHVTLIGKIEPTQPRWKGGLQNHTSVFHDHVYR